MADVFDANRLLIVSNRRLLVEGPIQNVDNVIHVRARRIEALGFSAASVPSHIFIRPTANSQGKEPLPCLQSFGFPAPIPTRGQLLVTLPVIGTLHCK